MAYFAPLLQELDISLEKIDPREFAVFATSTEIPAKTVAALRDGNHDAYNVIFNSYHEPLKAFVAKIVRSTDIAQEITQNVFINLWVKRESIDPARNIKGFLYITAKYLMLDHFKHQKVILKYQKYHSTSIDFAIPPDEEIIAQELALWIDIRIAEMPPQQQKVINLKFKDCKTNAEIAELLNISQETVKTHVTRGKNELREIIWSLLAILMMQ